MTNQTFEPGDVVKYVGEETSITRSLGIGCVENGMEVGGRVSVRWDRPVKGHPITWPLVSELVIVPLFEI